jgi:hypothetical protein
MIVNTCHTPAAASSGCTPLPSPSPLAKPPVRRPKPPANKDKISIGVVQDPMNDTKYTYEVSERRKNGLFTSFKRDVSHPCDVEYQEHKGNIK